MEKLQPPKELSVPRHFRAAAFNHSIHRVLPAGFRSQDMAESCRKGKQASFLVCHSFSKHCVPAFQMISISMPVPQRTWACHMWTGCRTLEKSSFGAQQSSKISTGWRRFMNVSLFQDAVSSLKTCSEAIFVLSCVSTQGYYFDHHDSQLRRAGTKGLEGSAARGAERVPPDHESSGTWLLCEWCKWASKFLETPKHWKIFSRKFHMGALILQKFCRTGKVRGKYSKSCGQ